MAEACLYDLHVRARRDQQRGEVVPQIVVPEARGHPCNVPRVPDGPVDLPRPDLLADDRLEDDPLTQGRRRRPCPRRAGTGITSGVFRSD